MARKAAKDTTLNALGAALEEARLTLRLDRQGLARALRLDRSTISRIGRGSLDVSSYSRSPLVRWATSLPPAIGEPVLRAIDAPMPVRAVAAAPVAAPVVVQEQPATPSLSETRRVVDEAFLAMADELDIGARSLRRALGRFLGAIEAGGVAVEAARGSIDAMERRAVTQGAASTTRASRRER